jgi:hypothetical protein
MTVIHLNDIRNEGRKYALLKDQLIAMFGLDAEDRALIDTLEGESDFAELCAAALREAKAREAMARGLKELIETLKLRKDRIEHSVKRTRALVTEAMLDAGTRKIIAPDMTVSLRDGKPRLDIDEERLSIAFKVPVTTYQVDKAAVQASVDRGDVPDGVQITNGSPILTVTVR